MTILYSIYTDKNLSACITEGYDRDEVIADAEDYYCTKAEEDYSWGAGERGAVLITYNNENETDAESVEEITLHWHAEKGSYDGGRFDYYSSRGCK